MSDNSLGIPVSKVDELVREFGFLLEQENVGKSGVAISASWQLRAADGWRYELHHGLFEDTTAIVAAPGSILDYEVGFSTLEGLRHWLHVVAVRR